MREQHLPNMSKHQFAIPPEFREQLRYREATDDRSDPDILDSLTKYREVTSEKNVWAFWDKGLEVMPGWCQRNVINWVRLLDSSWTVRVLDSVPNSPNYMLNYVPASSLNDAMVTGTMDGTYIGQHSADMVRGACIFAHGGVFMDVGIILIRDLDRICWNELSDPNSPFQVSVPWMFSTTIANHFVAGRKADPFIKRWYANSTSKSS